MEEREREREIVCLCVSPSLPPSLPPSLSFESERIHKHVHACRLPPSDQAATPPRVHVPDLEQHIAELREHIAEVVVARH